MPPPINDDVPFHLTTDADFIVRKIIDEMAPAGPDEYDQIAAECDKGANSFDGGAGLAHEVATELRRRAKAVRDAAK